MFNIEIDGYLNRIQSSRRLEREAHAEIHYVSADASGRIGWEANALKYLDRPAVYIIEVLHEKARNAYRAFLGRMGISHILAGKDQLDRRMAAEKLKALFKIGTLMLSGRGFVNWSFLQTGLID